MSDFSLENLICQQDNLETVLDSLKEGIIAHDMNRLIFFFNKEAERITGYSRQEIVDTLDQLLGAVLQMQQENEQQQGKGQSQQGGETEPLLPPSAEYKLLRASQHRDDLLLAFDRYQDAPVLRALECIESWPFRGQAVGHEQVNRHRRGGLAAGKCRRHLHLQSDQQRAAG